MDTPGDTSTPEQQAWERLGNLLAQRRVEIALNYRNRQKFIADTGLNERLVGDLERARRTGYRKETMRAVEIAYRIAAGSLERTLHGGDLEPLPEVPGAKTDPFRVPEGLEMPPNFDPTSLEPAVVHLFLTPGTPLRIRRTLVQMWLVSMGRDIGLDGSPSSGSASHGERLTAN